MKKAIRLLAIFLLIAVVVGIAGLRLKKYPPAPGWYDYAQPFAAHEQLDSKIRDTFLTENSESPSLRYKRIFEYFTLGFIKYRSANGALVYYPGIHSDDGVHVDGLEGFARFFPLAAAWLSANAGNVVDINGERINLIQLLHEGIVAGTDSQNPEYWGAIENYNQRIVEAADIALGLWISREQLWSTFSTEERKRIVAWLEQLMDRKVHKNNWELFPIITLKALQGLGINNQKYDRVIQEKYQRYKQHYIGEGWFNDPPKGVDYYNAWAIHYGLFWLDQMDSQFDPNFIRATHEEFLKFYRYLFGENGFPMMGRSVCYRMAAPTPLITGTLLDPKVVSPGLAYRALDLTWRFFVEHGALQYGTVTQGYCGPDLSILDNYSGSGSCLWSVRSLVAAFYVSKFIQFWESAPEKLPIEVSDFSVVNQSIGWLVNGKHSTQTIELHLLKEEGQEPPKIKEYGLLNRTAEFIFQRPFRPQNTAALYHRPVYSTASQVSTCETSTAQAD